jgi:hypothetical protein
MAPAGFLRPALSGLQLEIQEQTNKKQGHQHQNDHEIFISVFVGIIIRDFEDKAARKTNPKNRKTDYVI